MVCGSSPLLRTILTFWTALVIQEETGVKAELLPVDQSDFSSVVEFTRMLGDDPLVILVLNAGVVTTSAERTKDGWDVTYVLAP